MTEQRPPVTTERNPFPPSEMRRLLTHWRCCLSLHKPAGSCLDRDERDPDSKGQKKSNPDAGFESAVFGRDAVIRGWASLKPFQKQVLGKRCEHGPTVKLKEGDPAFNGLDFTDDESFWVYYSEFLHRPWDELLLIERTALRTMSRANGWGKQK